VRLVLPSAEIMSMRREGKEGRDWAAGSTGCDFLVKAGQSPGVLGSGAEWGESKVKVDW
jgi:hypothetical protein